MTEASDESVSDREKWSAEKYFREQDLDNAKRELDLKERELQFKLNDAAKSRWRSPLVIAVIAATVAAFGNAVVAVVNGIQSRQIEEQKSEQARILEMIKTGDPDSAAENLKVLMDTGLVKTPTIVSSLRDFLEKREPGTGPALASTSPLIGGIVGFDDAAPVLSFPTGHPVRRIAKSVGQIRVVRASGRTAICTAFLVDTDTIITASFCVADATDANVIFFPNNTPSDAVTYDLVLPPIHMEENIDGLNYALIEIVGEVDSNIRPLAIEDRGVNEGAQLATIMYRGGTQQLAVWGAGDCRVVKAEEFIFHHLCDTGGGSSGSPVIMLDTLSVVGMHFKRGRHGGIAVRLDAIEALRN